MDEELSSLPLGYGGGPSVLTDLSRAGRAFWSAERFMDDGAADQVAAKSSGALLVDLGLQAGIVPH